MSTAAQPVTAYFGLGANLGETAATLGAARDALARLPGSRLLACSALYRTEPVGGPPGQPDYANTVIALATALSPRELLAAAQTIEARFGRRRLERWGPRTLDIDLLLCGAQVLDDPDLVVPHPRLHLRRFVLVPLCELAPRLMHPLLGRPLQQLLDQLHDPARVERLETDW